MTTRSVVGTVISPEVPLEGDWFYSSAPQPCACGNRLLEVVEVAPSSETYPRRVAIYCPDCGAIGQDTCHGTAHAARRWNWHGDQRYLEFSAASETQEVPRG